MTGSRWDSWPARVSQDFFERSMKGHTKVRKVEAISPSRWDLTLVDGTEVKVFITDVYTFSASDYTLLRTKYPEVDLIVSASNWNHFSDEAMEAAAADGIQTVFLGSELMGALHGFVRNQRASG